MSTIQHKTFPHAHAARLGLAPLVLIAILASTVNAQASCQRPPARQFKAGETVVIPEPKSVPCKIEVVRMSIALRADADGKVANIAGRVTRAPDGRFFTSTGFAELVVWNADGTYAGKIGREGAGPGEFSRGPLNVHADKQGKIFVRDNSLRWSVFSPTNELIRSVSAKAMESNPEHSSLIDDGRFLGVSTYAMQPDFYFRLYDFQSGSDPQIAKSFGAVPDEEKLMPGDARERMISYSGGTEFWAGPPSTGRGYEIEQWRIDGTLRRTIRRDAPWFSKAASVTRPGAPERSKLESPPPPTQVVSFHEDGTGLIFVGVFVPNAKWRTIPQAIPRAERDKLIDEMADIHFEVIDANAGVVLALIGPMRRSQALAQLPIGLFAGSKQGYRAFETADGMPAMQIVEIRVVRK